jgi:DNA repair protein RecO
MVLQVTPMGEYDRRVVILTKEIGKISAFARGARKPSSSLVGVTSPFTFGQFTLYEGRSSYTLQNVSVVNYFLELREDVQKAYYGMYFMELADYYGREHNDEVLSLKLLYQTFRALAKESISQSLIRCIYELKIISINGEAPQVFHCVLCGEQNGEMFFSAASGGNVCQNCKERVADASSMQEATLYAIQYIVHSSVEKLYTFAVSKEVLRELLEVSKRYMKVFIGKEFQTLQMLEILGKTSDL